MRQATMTAPGVVDVREVPPPEPGEDEVLVRIHRIGVCGSDVHVNHGRHPFTSYPVIQGHEFAGVLDRLGQGVRDLRVGTKVTGLPQVTCGVCRPCRRGDYHICDVLKVQGFQAPGCAQDFFVTRADRIVPLPDAFSFEQGALVEPTAVAVHAVTRAGGVRGRQVVVIGAGPIGNLLAQVARAEGAEVLISDVSPFRIEIAKRCGIRHVADARTERLAQAAARTLGADGFDVAFECAGVQAAIDEAVGGIQKGGTIILVAVYADRPHMDTALIQDRELNVLGTLMYKREDFERAVELIGTGRVITAPLETGHFSLDRYADAYAFIDEARDRAMKVFIDV
jgi:L-iditol 2-dehydrogenase